MTTTNETEAAEGRADLNAFLDERGPDTDAAALSVMEAEKVPPSTTVLKLDRWTKRAGADLSETWQSDKEFPQTNADETADMFGALFDVEPEKAAKPTDKARAGWMEQLMATPEYDALHRQTVLNPGLSRLAATEFARQWLAYVETMEKEPGGDKPGGDGGDGQGEEPIQQTLSRMRSTREALQGASQSVDDAHAAAQGFGLGDVSNLSASTLLHYAKKLRGDSMLAAIMRWAGRAIIRAQSLQRQRTDRPGGEITGVELSGDIARLLPIELAAVAGGLGPERELLSLYKVATRQALSYKTRSREPVSQGPIVVTVDESGSMSGDRIIAAKGVALAIAATARMQRRPCKLFGFADTGDVWSTDGTAAPDTLSDWATHFNGGGTEPHGPLEMVPEQWPAGKVGAKADHIIITDGDMGIAPELVESYKAWARKHDVRTFVIGVGVRSVRSLEQVATRTWCVPSLDLDSMAVETVLAL